jgi:hypothetical protein
MSVDISGHSKKRGNTKSRSDQQSNRRNHSGFRDLRKRALAASFSAAISDYQTAAGGGRSNPWMTQTTRKIPRHPTLQIAGSATLGQRLERSLF